MVLKCSMGVLKADWASHTIVDKTVDFTGKDNTLNLSGSDSGRSTQNSATREITNEHREGEEAHVNSTHRLAQHGHRKEYCPPGGGSLGLWDPWAQSCSIVSLMNAAQTHRRDPGSLEHRDLFQKDTASWLVHHNSLCKRTGILLEIAQVAQIPGRYFNIDSSRSQRSPLPREE